MGTTTSTITKRAFREKSLRPFEINTLDPEKLDELETIRIKDRESRQNITFDVLQKAILLKRYINEQKEDDSTDILPHEYGVRLG